MHRIRENIQIQKNRMEQLEEMIKDKKKEAKDG